MNLPMVTLLMIKRSKMSMMVKMISSKMKDLQAKDIIYTLKNNITKREIITLVRDILMRSLMVMLLMIKKFKMSMMVKMTLSKTKDLQERDIIFMLKSTSLRNIKISIIISLKKNQMN